jgi:glutamyl-tRNA reductase
LGNGESTRRPVMWFRARNLSRPSAVGTLSPGKDCPDQSYVYSTRTVQIVVVGLNQNSAPLAVRERLAFVAGELPRALEGLRQHVPEGFILSTCNRVEVYGVAGHADSGAQLLSRFLAEARGFPVDELRPLIYSHAHEGAVAHLFRVASGLDSMVVGEGEVLSQVRSALEAANAAGTLGPVMRRLGSAAAGAGKRVRARTAIGRHSLSVVTLALQAAAAHGRAPVGASVLVIGAGETAETVLRHLEDARTARVVVASRRIERAVALATRYHATAIPLEEVPRVLADSDVVIGCTSAPDVVIRAGDVAAARRTASTKLLCLDLGVPRDIDPDVRGVPGVTLVDLDELQAAAEENRARRMREVEAAEIVVAAEVERFMDWWRSRQVVPTIAALRAYAAQVRDSELARALARLNELPPRDVFVIQALAQRIVAKLLHRPLTVLKADAEGANMAQMLQQLFQLELDAQHDAECPSGAAADVRIDTRQESSTT